MVFVLISFPDRLTPLLSIPDVLLGSELVLVVTPFTNPPGITTPTIYLFPGTPARLYFPVLDVCMVAIAAPSGILSPFASAYKLTVALLIPGSPESCIPLLFLSNQTKSPIDAVPKRPMSNVRLPCSSSPSFMGSVSFNMVMCFVLISPLISIIPLLSLSISLSGLLLVAMAKALPNPIGFTTPTMYLQSTNSSK